MPEFPFFFLEMASYSGFEVVLGRAYVGIHAFCEMKPAQSAYVYCDVSFQLYD